MTTAVVKVQDKRGNLVVARALLDSCSTVNLITSKFADSLKLNKIACSINIGAVDGLSTVSKQQVNVTFQSNYNNLKHQLTFLIVPNIADAVPNDIFPRGLFDIPKTIRLADPQFHLPKPVDLLLASRTTLSILAVGQLVLHHGNSEMVLQKTSLGWICAGGPKTLNSSSQASCNVVKLDKLIERFWIVEDLDHEPSKSRDEVACEEHYVTHTRRESSGRYVVRLPFRDNRYHLGDSRQQALRRYYSLQRKFESNPVLKQEYTKAMEEYISLGHMSLCKDIEGGYTLPHHCVIKESSETTKYRPVFDASSKTSTGLSLNDTFMVGPTIQNTIFEQVLRFRTHTFVITADIEKMYRQILVHPDDRRYLKILWPHQGNLSTWELNTVTFGTACAPFLAIRTLQQLAHDEAKDFPRASKLLLRDFYVDDFVSGAESLEEILQIRDEMIALLNRGGFQIRKWASNHQSALDTIDREIFNLDCLVKESPVHKTLGIVWDSRSDHYKYTFKDLDPHVVSTKRNLLSELSKIFDPLGLLGPVVLYAKVMIQDCWKAKITWDESLPQNIHTKWKAFANQLSALKTWSIPRQIVLPKAVRIELHGFCDACSYGYGACLFARTIDSKGQVSIRLIGSKSRVAPLNGLTIPRLELCAASILKKLYVKSKPQLEFPIDKVTFWSDSTIVLCWLKKAPCLLRVFESNRAEDIQSLGDEVCWRHVRSEDNPADALSRGQLPSEFVENRLWSSGPHWLSCDEHEWPQSIEPSISNLPGLKQGRCLVTTKAANNSPVDSSSFEEIYSRFSSFEVFSRVWAYALRWKAKSRVERRLTRLFPEIENNAKRIHEIVGLVRPLLPSEIGLAETKILTTLQREAFPSELRCLADSSSTHQRKTPFDKLNPFIGKDNLLRVGGRLKESDKPYHEKHPVLLPSKHALTSIIIRQFHEANSHAGISTTLYALRWKYFVLNAKNEVRRVVRHCVQCLRHKPPVVHAQMADLPIARVTESPPFCHTGLDFFGPLSIKEKAHKNRVILKVYGCVFVCMASKAVHIELATDLSTEGFLMAFRRFIGRRGVPAHVYSDNGTNFVGASKDLREIYDRFENSKFRKEIGEYAISKRIEWHFNPPLSPHFGGIWEAAVKSFKHHLKRIVNSQLTYPQLNTLLIEIEAILNSRPLCVLSSDPNDPLAISPAHLLIGRPFNVLPEEFMLSVPENRLTTYNFITKARQNFWDKWHKEYLHQLQIRQKWQSSTGELKVGDVVIMMDDITHCSRWPLGVIIEVHPGRDGICRVASVKTANGVYTRNITKLCVLPIA